MVWLMTKLLYQSVEVGANGRLTKASLRRSPVCWLRVIHSARTFHPQAGRHRRRCGPNGCPSTEPSANTSGREAALRFVAMPDGKGVLQLERYEQFHGLSGRRPQLNPGPRAALSPPED